LRVSALQLRVWDQSGIFRRPAIHSGCQSSEVTGSFNDVGPRLYLRATHVFLSGAVNQHLEKTHMHRLSTSLLGFGVLAAVSCGAPAELDVDRFPAIDDTGYSDEDATGGPAATATPPLTGAAGSVASPMGAAGTAGATSVAPPVSGTGGASNNGGGTPPAPAASGAGSGAMAAAAGGSGMAPAAGGCPTDITVLFDRPIEQGGCNGAACHIPGATRPDLISPNPEQRLVNIQSTCNGLPYIGQGPEDSFLALKITTPPDSCGLTMPFFMPQALNADDEACILAWIDQVSGG
jgi:hypothetical protein